jgi:Immunity protein 53
MNRPSSMTQSIIEGLESWFSARCDGDWEHSYGLSIESTDNPGWHVEIDLMETVVADTELAFSREERSESDWVQFEIRAGKFVGSGGVGNLAEILRRFLVLARA